MSPNDDPVFEALASLPPIVPDAGWEARVRARCHTAIFKRATLRGRVSRNLSGPAFTAVSGAVFLYAYLAEVFAEVVRLARHS
jgi:hypothetical protein